MKPVEVNVTKMKKRLFIERKLLCCVKKLLWKVKPSPFGRDSSKKKRNPSESVETLALWERGG